MIGILNITKKGSSISNRKYALLAIFERMRDT